jgi:hypothetical protein
MLSTEILSKVFEKISLAAKEIGRAKEAEFYSKSWGGRIWYVLKSLPKILMWTIIIFYICLFFLTLMSVGFYDGCFYRPDGYTQVPEYNPSDTKHVIGSANNNIRITNLSTSTLEKANPYINTLSGKIFMTASGYNASEIESQENPMNYNILMAKFYKGEVSTPYHSNISINRSKCANNCPHITNDKPKDTDSVHGTTSVIFSKYGQWTKGFGVPQYLDKDGNPAVSSRKRKIFLKIQGRVSLCRNWAYGWTIGGGNRQSILFNGVTYNPIPIPRISEYYTVSSGDGATKTYTTITIPSINYLVDASYPVADRNQLASLSPIISQTNNNSNYASEDPFITDDKRAWNYTCNIPQNAMANYSLRADSTSIPYIFRVNYKDQFSIILGDSVTQEQKEGATPISAINPFRLQSNPSSSYESILNSIQVLSATCEDFALYAGNSEACQSVGSGCSNGGKDTDPKNCILSSSGASNMSSPCSNRATPPGVSDRYPVQLVGTTNPSYYSAKLLGPMCNRWIKNAVYYNYRLGFNYDVCKTSGSCSGISNCVVSPKCEMVNYLKKIGHKGGNYNNKLYTNGTFTGYTLGNTNKYPWFYNGEGFVFMMLNTTSGDGKIINPINGSLSNYEAGLNDSIFKTFQEDSAQPREMVTLRENEYGHRELFQEKYTSSKTTTISGSFLTHYTSSCYTQDPDNLGGYNFKIASNGCVRENGEYFSRYRESYSGSTENPAFSSIQVEELKNVGQIIGVIRSKYISASESQSSSQVDQSTGSSSKSVSEILSYPRSCRDTNCLVTAFNKNICSTTQDPKVAHNNTQGCAVVIFRHSDERQGYLEAEIENDVYGELYLNIANHKDDYKFSEGQYVISAELYEESNNFVLHKPSYPSSQPVALYKLNEKDKSEIYAYQNDLLNKNSEFAYNTQEKKELFFAESNLTSLRDVLYHGPYIMFPAEASPYLVIPAAKASEVLSQFYQSMKCSIKIAFYRYFQFLTCSKTQLVEDPKTKCVKLYNPNIDPKTENQ